MFKSIFNNILDHQLIIIQDSIDCRGDELFKVVPSLVPLNVEHISAPFVLKTPDLSSIVSDESKVVYIESISPFLWGDGVHKVSKALKHLTTKGKVVIVNVNSDTLLDEADAAKLSYLSTASVRILQTIGDRRYRVKVSTRKKHQTEIVEIRGDNEVICSISTKTVEQIEAIPVRTTFNLGVNLSETEKQAKDALILPYLRNKEESGAIIYNADDADLEEDPDEDLEL